MFRSDRDLHSTPGNLVSLSYKHRLYVGESNCGPRFRQTRRSVGARLKGLDRRKLSVPTPYSHHCTTSSVLRHPSASCTTFTVGSPPPYDETPDLSSRLPALCTNSAPLTRSNVMSHDTTRQIDVSTPKAGILRGFRDKFAWRFLGVKYTESTAGQGRFQPPRPLDVPSNTVRTALAYGPFCAQVGLVYLLFLPLSRNACIAPRRR